MTLLRVENLGKAYRTYRSEFQRVAGWFGVPSKPVDEHWVLRHVTFNMDRGEAIGIVGQNGAGKSTLLKIVTGTLQPTEGQVHIDGRIAAILELGMGFNPELTGRQNAVHTAGLMGYEAGQIALAMPEIESFAEIGEYFDEPVRTYSSGMQMRVAFSVSTAFRPDVLIVDEALSVGDAYFQHKSFNRIREFRKKGTTLLIVSHDREAVQSLCERAVLLDKGRVLRDADPQSVMDLYNALLFDRENSTVSQVAHDSGGVQTTSGTGEARVEEVRLTDAAGHPVEIINVGQAVELAVRVRAYSDVPRLVLGYAIKDRLGQYVFGTNTHYTRQAIEGVRSGEEMVFRIRFPMNVGPGSYSVSTALVSTETHLVNNYEWRDLALLFQVANLDKPGFVGNAWVPPVIEIESL